MAHIMERLSTLFQITDSNLESGQFEGMASVFGSMVDAYCPTVIHPGAFMKTLQERTSRVKVLWQHNPDWPIGLPVILEETPVGLRMRAQMSKTALGNDAMTLIRDGVVDELSIGFDPIKFDFEQVNGEEVRNIRELRLWEVSPVTFAADPMARITEANRRNGGEVTDEAERLSAALTMFRDLHSGKVLSSKNKSLVQDAIDALQVLLTAAEPPAAPDAAQALTRDVEQLLLMVSLDARLRGIPVAV